ncbi:hypothetical protein GCM10009564_23160 [Streptomyces thermogriseus]|uniref:Secreted protein n=1 Tax=Streptomyces thermogriseus TaxID=75292 RepID=A0ABN1SY72_9ACTN
MLCLGSKPCTAGVLGARVFRTGPGFGSFGVLASRVIPASFSTGSSPRFVSGPACPPLAEAAVASAVAEWLRSAAEPHRCLGASSPELFLVH